MTITNNSPAMIFSKFGKRIEVFASMSKSILEEREGCISLSHVTINAIKSAGRSSMFMDDEDVWEVCPDSSFSI